MKQYKAIIKTKFCSIEVVKPSQQEAYIYAKEVAAQYPGCYWAVVPYGN